MTLLSIGPGVGPAFAHGGELSEEAQVLVRQSIALIVADPNQRGEITERVEAALDAPDVAGVDLGVVEQAGAALADGRDLGEVRALLEQSIGAGPVTAPPDGAPPPASTDPPPTAAPTEPSSDAMATMPTGAEPGTTVLTDSLETRPRLSATDWTVLIGSIAIGLAGVWLGLRYRPTIRVEEVTR